MMNQLRKLAALSIAAMLSFCGVAAATTLQRMSVADMSRASHTIVRAHCVANSTRWDAGEIWTFTTFDVEDIWKGSAPLRITVRLLGGEAGNLKSTVSGVPRFAPGEQLVLFLERTTAGDFSVVSWVQGTFRIGHDRTTDEEIVTQDTAAFAVLDPASHRFETSGIRKMRTDAFRALVAAALENARGSKQ
jgi:hypothetical protein